MITLHQFPPVWGINPSPFCMKVETFLRLTGLPYTITVSMPYRGPKGKLPFIVDDGETIADSRIILAHLVARHGLTLDEGLTDAQRARGHLLCRTCEESLYFIVVWFRWIDPAGWAIVRKAFFETMPTPVRAVLPVILRRRVAFVLHAQGTGRHTPEQIRALGEADLGAISTCLAETHFSVGEEPTTYDCTLYAFLLSILAAPATPVLRRFVEERPALTDYVARMEQRLGR